MVPDENPDCVLDHFWIQKIIWKSVGGTRIEYWVSLLKPKTLYTPGVVVIASHASVAVAVAVAAVKTAPLPDPTLSRACEHCGTLWSFILLCVCLLRIHESIHCGCASTPLAVTRGRNAGARSRLLPKSHNHAGYKLVYGLQLFVIKYNICKNLAGEVFT